MIPKSEIKKIIAYAVKQQITVKAAVEQTQWNINQFNNAKRKYGLKLPKYLLKIKCDHCSAIYYMYRLGKGKTCPACKVRLQQQACRDWRKKNPGYRASHRKKSRPISASQIRSTSGWTYNEKRTEHFKGICQKCHKAKRLNYFGLCYACYHVESNNLANPNEPCYHDGAYPEKLSERAISIVPKGI